MSATAYLYSPLGMLALTGSEAGPHAVRFLDHEAPAPTAPAAVPGCLQATFELLKAYFGRELREFSLP